MRGATYRWLSISGDGGFLFTASELATAMRHGIPLVTIVFSDGAFGNVRRTQQERYGNRLIACDLANPGFRRFRQKLWRRGRARKKPGGIAPRLAPRLRASRRSDDH